MSLSNSEQQDIQNDVEAASTEELEEMREKAKSKLRYLKLQKDHGASPSEYEHEALYAIEILTRIEATESNKGAWFRTKRRMALTKQYLIS